MFVHSLYMYSENESFSVCRVVKCSMSLRLESVCGFWEIYTPAMTRGPRSILSSTRTGRFTATCTQTPGHGTRCHQPGNSSLNNITGYNNNNHRDITRYYKKT
jgi:hypothetical protein